MNSYTVMGHDNCPVCKERLDAVTSMEDIDYKPSPKDLTICMYCAAVLVFEDDMALSEYSPVLFDTLDPGTQRSLLIGIAGILKNFEPKSEELAILRIENADKYASRISE